MVKGANSYKLNAGNLRSILELIAGTVAHAGGDYEITIKKWREKRTLSQNALYWVWMDEISKRWEVEGRLFKAEEWHEELRDRYCPPRTINKPSGAVSVRSTTKLDTGEMHWYMNVIERVCINRGILLPIPEHSEYMKLREAQED